MTQRKRPVIGINSDFTLAGKFSPPQMKVPVGYVDSIFNTGGMPIILPTMTKDANYDEMLDMLDGIVLTGGLDMDPRRQNQPTHATVVPMAERRELNDRKLLEKVMERKLPLLAVGLGMQQLNAILGGTLHLHIPAELPNALQHFDPSGGPHRHIVFVEPGTRMRVIYGDPIKQKDSSLPPAMKKAAAPVSTQKTELRVNSAHHQAIKTLGQKLRVAAKSPDDVIEAIESTDPNWFCIGVQWHPESETASALDRQLFDAFVSACVPAQMELGMVA